jgi:hypothetical protein
MKIVKKERCDNEENVRTPGKHDQEKRQEIFECFETDDEMKWFISNEIFDEIFDKMPKR